MANLVRREDLPYGGSAYCFEGHRFGEVGISFFLTNGPSGSGPRWHRHRYAEVFVVEEGCVTFTVGEETIAATAGQIVVVLPGQPHTFVAAGPGPARQLDVHASGEMITEWLEE